MSGGHFLDADTQKGLLVPCKKLPVSAAFKKNGFRSFLSCIIKQENWRSSRSRKLELLSENPLKSISIKSCHAIETNDPIVELGQEMYHNSSQKTGKMSFRKSIFRF